MRKNTLWCLWSVLLLWELYNVHNTRYCVIHIVPQTSLLILTIFSLTTELAGPLFADSADKNMTFHLFILFKIFSILHLTVQVTVQVKFKYNNNCSDKDHN